MHETTTIASEKTRGAATNKSNSMRLFYVICALIVVALTLIGFQEFYLHGRAFPGRQISPRIFPLVVTHGALMTAWVVLFTVQPFLIVKRHVRWHMMLGRIGIVLAAAIFMVGIAVAIASLRVRPEGEQWGLTRKQFTAIPITDMLKFLVFVSIGVLTRRRPQIHRSMMLLATLSILIAAAARIPLLRLYQGTIGEYLVGPALPILVLGAIFLIAQWSLTRNFDRSYALGYAGLLITAPLIMVLARSRAWDQIATFLLQ